MLWLSVHFRSVVNIRIAEWNGINHRCDRHTLHEFLWIRRSVHRIVISQEICIRIKRNVVLGSADVGTPVALVIFLMWFRLHIPGWRLMQHNVAILIITQVRLLGAKRPVELRVDGGGVPFFRLIRSSYQRWCAWSCSSLQRRKMLGRIEFRFGRCIISDAALTRLTAWRRATTLACRRWCWRATFAKCRNNSLLFCGMLKKPQTKRWQFHVAENASQIVPFYLCLHEYLIRRRTKRGRNVTHTTIPHIHITYDSSVSFVLEHRFAISPLCIVPEDTRLLHFIDFSVIFCLI